MAMMAIIATPGQRPARSNPYHWPIIATRPTMKHLSVLAAIAITFAAVGARAQTTVNEAWIRGTVPQQKATGLFAEITSAHGGRLLSASSPVAGVVEIHEMAMEGDVMKMRALPGGLTLPAGKAVALSPGGYHVMLMDLKRQLKAGDTVPVTLVVEGADKRRETVEVKAAVRDPAAPMPKH
jgi:copper(I)-binding protein